MKRKNTQNAYLLSLQDKWLETGVPLDLLKLELELVPIAESLIKKLLAKTGSFYDANKLQDMAEVATGRLIELMERNRKNDVPYYVERFSTRLFFDCKKVMFEKQYRWLSDGAVSIDDLHILPMAVPEELYTPEELFDKVLEDSRGKRVIVSLFIAPTYKEAILNIEKFKSRSWIYNNAVALKSIYDHTRGKANYATKK